MTAAVLAFGAGTASASAISLNDADDHADDSGFAGVMSPAYATGAATSDTPGVNLRKSELNAVYGQASFGATPVEIRYNPLVELAAPSLTRVSSKAEVNELFGLTSALYSNGTINRAVNLYFVEPLDYCGRASSAFVGCTKVGGNQMAVERKYANGRYGAELIAHELGHALGLYHSGQAPLYVGNNNLMSKGLNNNKSITTTQVAQMLGQGVFARWGANPLIQSDANGRFIEITPHVIVSALSASDPVVTQAAEEVAASIPLLSDAPSYGAVAAVPVPPAGFMMLVGVAALAGLRRARRA